MNDGSRERGAKRSSGSATIAGAEAEANKREEGGAHLHLGRVGSRLALARALAACQRRGEETRTTQILYSGKGR